MTCAVVRLFACAALIISSGARAPAVAETRTERLNIIVILVDDMGFSDIGAYGGEIPTPNIDALATNGLRFTDFYNTARCSPTRASLLTGLYPHQAGMGYLPSTRLPESRGLQGRLLPRVVTIAEALQSTEYLTAIAGKWHLTFRRDSTPWERGFERSMVARAGGIYFPDQRFQTERFLWIDGEKVPLSSKRLSEDYWYMTDLLTDWSIRFIDDAQEQGRPFFLYLSHVAPHFPLMAPQENISQFRGAFMKGWDELREERFKRQKAMGLIDQRTALPAFLPETYPWDSLSKEEKKVYDELMAIYAAAIHRIDLAIGKLVNHLSETGQLDNTLILFLSDNGGNAESGPDGRHIGEPLGGPDSRVFVGMNWATLQNTPFSYFKHHTHEGGVATPLIVHWPNGISAGLRGHFVSSPGHVIDILPTVLELTGGIYPSERQGVEILPFEGLSLVPTFTGRRLAREEPIFWEHEGNRAIRSGRWKAVSLKDKPWRLYDLGADRTETKDLGNDHPERLQTMIEQWKAWAERSFVDEWKEDRQRQPWGGFDTPKKPGRGANRQDVR